MKRLMILPLLLLSGMAAAEKNTDPKTFQRFNNPTFQGYPLDWCATWADHCGAEAANQFCVSREFDYAVEFRIKADIGSTKLLTGERCIGDFCDGFEFIRCAREL